MSEREKKLERPELALLEAELERVKYKNSFGQVLRSTVFSLLVVAAAAVLIVNKRRHPHGQEALFVNRLAAAVPAAPEDEAEIPESEEKEI